MRRILRPWPPRNVRRDDEAAQSLPEADTDLQQALASRTSQEDRREFARGAFDNVDKVKMRAGMYLHQHSLCAYCEAELNEGAHPAPRIDHWIPISHDPAQALNWANLYLSCPRHGTCDDAKGETVPKELTGMLLPKPCDFDYQDHIGFNSLGEVYVRIDTGLNENTRTGLIEITGKNGLNLNHPTLQAARKSKIDAERLRFERRFAGRTATPSERDDLAREYETKDCWADFTSIRTAWLKKQLGKGQAAHS